MQGQVIYAKKELTDKLSALKDYTIKPEYHPHHQLLRSNNNTNNLDGMAVNPHFHPQHILHLDNLDSQKSVQ